MPTAVIGRISRERYEQIIAADRELVGQMQRIQFTIGDHANEIEPVQQVGGAHPAPARTCPASTPRCRSMPMTWGCR
ncbi:MULTISPECIES: hypothetical protein [unclassified Streptomyces]|uniref:hypothetical protein n=1 Tax=unclassified Streptomyces TaxID=2593676 RepID=UPI002E8230FB|nr:hypothetical protein [Streptomyces sp. NBC_00589]